MTTTTKPTETAAATPPEPEPPMSTTLTRATDSDLIAPARRPLAEAHAELIAKRQRFDALIQEVCQYNDARIQAIKMRAMFVENWRKINKGIPASVMPNAQALGWPEIPPAQTAATIELHGLHAVIVRLENEIRFLKGEEVKV